MCEEVERSDVSSTAVGGGTAPSDGKSFRAVGDICRSQGGWRGGGGAKMLNSSWNVFTGHADRLASTRIKNTDSVLILFIVIASCCSFLGGGVPISWPGAANLRTQGKQ